MNIDTADLVLCAAVVLKSAHKYPESLSSSGRLSAIRLLLQKDTQQDLRKAVADKLREFRARDRRIAA